MDDAETEECQLKIWDTLGQEKFRCLNSAYYRNAHAAIVVVDASAPPQDSIAQIRSWVQELHDYLPENLPVFVVANKTDLEPELSRSSGAQSNTTVTKAYAKVKGYSFLRASAKANPNSVKAIFDTVLATIWFDLRTRALREKELKQGAGGTAVEVPGAPDASLVFDDENSKDLGRR